ncbi:MAG: cell wall-binding repeat-containing protein, partial [Parcubacteria group bacterium]
LKKIERLAGPNRYESNLAIVKRFTSEPENLIFATGANYPDALTGSTLVGAEKGALVLSKLEGLTKNAQTFVDTTREALEAALVVGGTSALKPSLDKQLAASLNQPLTLAAQPTSGQIDNRLALQLWSTTKRATLSDLKVPAPPGYAPTTKNYRGAQVTSLVSWREGSEYAPPIVVTELPVASEATTALANWFGLEPAYIESHIQKQAGYFELMGVPNLFETRTLIQDLGSTLKIVEVRLDPAAGELVIPELTSQLSQTIDLTR